MGAAVGEDLAPALRRRSPIRFRISTRGALRSVAPSGRPQIARIWFSNCEVTRALDRPVAAIVHARRHLVEHRLVADREEFERQHPDIVERLGDAARQRLGRGDRPGRAPAPAGTVERSRMPRLWTLRGASQSAISPSGARQSRIENSASNAIRASSIAGRAADRLPRRRRLAGRTDPHLALAVIAEAAASSGSPACRARPAPPPGRPGCRPRAKAPGVRPGRATNAFSVSRSWAISSASRGGCSGTLPVKRGERRRPGYSRTRRWRRRPCRRTGAAPPRRRSRRG